MKLIKTIYSFFWLLGLTWNSDNRKKIPLKKWLKRIWKMAKSIYTDNPNDSEWNAYKWLKKHLKINEKKTLEQKKLNILKEKKP